MRIVIILVVAFLAWQSHGAAKSDVVLDFAPKADGARYKEALASLIRRSDRIVVIEHSSRYDLYDVETEKYLISDEITYDERTLTKGQRDFFLVTIKALDPETQEGFSGCIPVVHHTFYFYVGDQLQDTLGVCFQCNQVLWSGTKAVPPWSLYTGLAKVLVEFGLSPRRDWSKVAREALK
jgi:hypothetical protein